MAVMIDADEDAEDGAALVEVALTPVCPDGCAQRAALAAASLVRCIAIALVAARHVGLYEWDGRFPVRDLAEMVAWDQIEGVEWAIDPIQSR